MFRWIECSSHLEYLAHLHVVVVILSIVDRKEYDNI